MFVDDDRRVAGDVCFHHAAVAAVELLLAVLVAQVYFHAVNLVEAADVFFHDGLNVFVQALVFLDGAVGVNVNLHKWLH